MGLRFGRFFQSLRMSVAYLFMPITYRISHVAVDNTYQNSMILLVFKYYFGRFSGQNEG